MKLYLSQHTNHAVPLALRFDPVGWPGRACFGGRVIFMGWAARSEPSPNCSLLWWSTFISCFVKSLETPFFYLGHFLRLIKAYFPHVRHVLRFFDSVVLWRSAFQFCSQPWDWEGVQICSTIGTICRVVEVTFAKVCFVKNSFWLPFAFTHISQQSTSSAEGRNKREDGLCRKKRRLH